MICEVMAEGFNELCGPKHHPNTSGHVRAGSASGRAIFVDSLGKLIT